MKARKFFIIVNFLGAVMTLTGCARKGNEVWDDTRSAGRHMSRGMRTMGGKCGDSRQIRNRDEFLCQDENSGQGYVNNSDYVPLADQMGSDDIAMADVNVRPPRNSPGDPGSPIPGIDSFQDPSTNPQLASTFRVINFEYNSSLVKGDDNITTVRNIADYMRRSPETYIFVEGHADERGPEAYNLALGARRSNSIRNMLVQDGVNPDNVFTVSFGKERPLAFGNDEQSWSQNRRAEFRVYQR